MHRYFIKTPRIVRWLFPHYVWRMPGDEKAIYLSFDDGPHPRITPWVLELLREHEAKATFFCIGKNVQEHPAIFQRIINEGHAVGNHTFQHRNGWQTEEKEYLDDVARAATLIPTNLFRPPYGRIRQKQAAGISSALQHDASRIIMWDVLSADFDANFTPQQCLEHVVEHTVAGSIVVFHDSEKAFRNLEYVLPRVLGFFRQEGYEMRRID